MTTMLWLPDATRVPHPRTFPWQETTDPKGCLHTTETSGYPGYDGWTIMPHGDVMPRPGRDVLVRQFLPLSQASFSLRHTRPQPTGGDYVFQWELIGTCSPSGPGYYWPNADDAVLLSLYRKVIRPLDQAFVIPMRAVPFLAYPYPAGQNRLTDAQFDTYSGWLGHQHVPQNDHGDPGAFPWARLAALAAAWEEQQVALTDSDVDRVADEIERRVGPAVWRQQVGSAWDGQPQSAERALTSAQRYAIEAGFNGTRPDGNGRPGTPTWAEQLEGRLDALEAGQQSILDALGKLTPPATS